MLRGDPIQCHNKKSLCSHPVPCNLHRITMIYLTLTSHNFTTYIPHIRSISRPISRTLIARHADADMAAKNGRNGRNGRHFQKSPLTISLDRLSEIASTASIRPFPSKPPSLYLARRFRQYPISIGYCSRSGL